MKHFLLLLACLSLSFFNARTQNTSSSPLIFIYDASGSMWGAMEGKTKMQIAGQVLTQTLDQLPEDQAIGLFAYGHRREKDCSDVEWLLPMTNQDKNLLRESIGSIKPLGRTPLARSAQQVIDQLRSTNQKATVILITDGIESCDGDLCEVVRIAKADGVDFKLHIVGFGLKDDETAALKCATEAGGGQYFDASNTTSLAAGLQEATTITVDETPLVLTEPSEPNLSLYATKNGVPVDSWIAATPLDSDDKYTSLRTYGDTSKLSLAPGRYSIAFRPLEGSNVRAKTLDVVEVFADSIIHRNISFDSGKLAVFISKNGEGSDATYQIYPQEEGAKKVGGRTYAKRKETELDPGLYRVEIKLLNVSGTATTHTFEDVVVRGTETTELTHDFASGQLGVMTTNNDAPWDCTFQVYDLETDKKVTSGRTYAKHQTQEINPGTYRVGLLALQVSGESRNYEIGEVEIRANETTEITHNFLTGTLKVGASNTAGLVDAIVRINKASTNTRVAGGRTYTTENSNPRSDIVVPDTYEVTVTGIGEFKGLVETFTITIEPGQTVERNVKF